MGTWGTGLFSDDITADLRGDFRDLIGEGVSPEEATARLVAEYQPESDPLDLAPPFWLALASVQWSLGRLLPDVRAKALSIIDSGADLARWDEPKDRKKREAVLLKLRETLESPLPAPKKVPRRIREANDWPVGAVYSYRLESGNFCLFVVSGHHEDKGGRYAKLELLDWQGYALPSSWRIHIMRRRLDSWTQAKNSLFGMTLIKPRAIAEGRLNATGIKTWVRGREIPYLLRIRPYVLRDLLWKSFRIRRVGGGWIIDGSQLDRFLKDHTGLE